MVNGKLKITSKFSLIKNMDFDSAQSDRHPERSRRVLGN